MSLAQRDRPHQLVVLTLAIAQAAVTIISGDRIQGRVGTGPPTPVEPDGYAFANWFLIFLLCIVYGVWQARPSVGANPLLRRVGWPMAGAFLTIVGWSLVVPFGWLMLAQGLLLATWALLAYAAFQLADEAAGRSFDAGERWQVSLPLAMFLGWVTAANGVSLFSQLASVVDLNPANLEFRAIGAALLVLTGVVAAVVLRRTRAAPIQFSATYAATIAWAIVAIIINQWNISPLIVVAALLASLPPAAVIIQHQFLPLGPGGRMPSAA